MKENKSRHVALVGMSRVCVARNHHETVVAACRTPRPKRALQQRPQSAYCGLLVGSIHFCAQSPPAAASNWSCVSVSVDIRQRHRVDSESAIVLSRRSSCHQNIQAVENFARYPHAVAVDGKAVREAHCRQCVMVVVSDVAHTAAEQIKVNSILAINTLPNKWREVQVSIPSAACTDDGGE